MEIIAKTDSGYLINATKSEIEEILSAVQGAIPELINIGQKIPAIDYSATIKKLKKLPEEFCYKKLITYAEEFSDTISNLREVVDNATKI